MRAVNQNYSLQTLAFEFQKNAFRNPFLEGVYMYLILTYSILSCLLL